jgi:hypothetical protein
VTDPEQTTVRRAPKYGTFMIFGGLLGLLVTLILTTSQPADPNVGFGALFAYFSLFGVPAGIALGAGIAILLDVISRRRARAVDVEIERVDPEA